MQSLHQPTEHHHQRPTATSTSSYITSPVATNFHLYIRLHNITSSDQLALEQEAK